MGQDVGDMPWSGLVELCYVLKWRFMVPCFGSVVVLLILHSTPRDVVLVWC